MRDAPTRRVRLDPRLAICTLGLLLAGLLSLGAIDPAPASAQQRPGPTPTRTATPPATSTPRATPNATPRPTSETDDEGEGDAAPTATATPTVPPRAYPVLDDQPGDYDVPNGHFYSQAVPGAPRGFGFVVADAAGVPLWSEYRRLGGLAELGYPVSRRFAWGDTVAQAFQFGLLRWRPEQARAEQVPREQLATLPAYAAEPEPPARLGAWAARQPWSGWWWPATSAVRGPHLFDPGGPLAKYDLLVTRSGREDPRTLEWERKELVIDGPTWAGHCNGWAAAALLEEEPFGPVTVGGITFSVADQKGLLSAYHFADSAVWLYGTDEEPLSPVDFHRALVEWLGNGKKGFAFTFRPSQDEEVWTYPAAGFELLMGPDPLEPDLTHVRATVWLADNDVPADFVGIRPWRGDGQTYSYTLAGPRDAPTSGTWTGPSAAGRFARPAAIWYPNADHRNLDRQLVSPNLEYDVIKRIVKGG